MNWKEVVGFPIRLAIVIGLGILTLPLWMILFVIAPKDFEAADRHAIKNFLLYGLTNQGKY